MKYKIEPHGEEDRLGNPNGVSAGPEVAEGIQGHDGLQRRDSTCPLPQLGYGGVAGAVLHEVYAVAEKHSYSAGIGEPGRIFEWVE